MNKLDMLVLLLHLFVLLNRYSFFPRNATIEKVHSKCRCAQKCNGQKKNCDNIVFVINIDIVSEFGLI